MKANDINKIEDFGQKIGGARKDYYTEAREAAAQYLTAANVETLKNCASLGALVKLPHLATLTKNGALSAEAARAVLVLYRSIERKPSRTWRATRWAEPTEPTDQGEHTPTTTGDNTEPTEADDTEPTETGSTTAQTGANATLYEAGEITDTAPTDTAEDFSAVLAADRLKLLRSAAADFDRLTQAGEHVAAVNARLSALFACGVDVADLVQCADYKADQCARQRAAVVLTPDEFRTLYGCGPDEQPEDCGRVWQFERCTDDNGHELHEIRRVPSGFMVFLNVCEATGGGCSTMAVYPTYCEALEVLTRCRPGAQLIAQPAA